MKIGTKPDEGRCLRKPIQKGSRLRAQATEARRAEVLAPRLRGGWGLNPSYLRFFFLHLWIVFGRIIGIIRFGFPINGEPFLLL